jgi:hypothetical protein
MSAARDNGGPAFPVDDAMAHTIAHAATVDIKDPYDVDRVYIKAKARAAEGMTLRDYAAIQFAAAWAVALGSKEMNEPYDSRAMEAMRLGDLQADAMLKARQA